MSVWFDHQNYDYSSDVMINGLQMCYFFSVPHCTHPLWNLDCVWPVINELKSETTNLQIETETQITNSDFKEANHSTVSTDIKKWSPTTNKSFKNLQSTFCCFFFQFCRKRIRVLNRFIFRRFSSMYAASCIAARLR